METTKLINASKLSHELNLSVATITKWARTGVIPTAIAEGYVYRFDLTKVREALAARAAKKVD